VNEVVAGLTEGGRPLAGGTVLVPSLVSQADVATTLWDLQELSELYTISSDSGAIRIGAMASLASLHSSAMISSEFAALAEAALAVGNPQVRNAGTLGGNLASPSTDLPPALLVLEAEVVQAKPDGTVVQSVEQFLGTAPTGLITEVRLPRKTLRRSRFIKFSWRAASGRTIASVSGVLTVKDGQIVEARFACGGVSTKPARLTAVETAVLGQTLAETVFQEAARRGAAEVVIEADQPPAEEYRRHLVRAGILQALKDMTHESR
jgi:aerobic carbon-monoxide dehydrogenase medium subunit